MDWTGFNIPFHMDDIIAGVTKTFTSFEPLVLLFLGISLALFALDGLLAVFVRKESFFPWNR